MFALSASVASRDKTPVFKVKAWRKGEQALKDVVAQYKEVGAELNVLPFCSQFIPMDVINYPRHKSICYHPSILPKHRGVSAINWLVFSTHFSCLFIIQSPGHFDFAEESGKSIAGADFREHCWPLFIKLEIKSVINVYAFYLFIIQILKHSEYFQFNHNFVVIIPVKLFQR